MVAMCKFVVHECPCREGQYIKQLPCSSPLSLYSPYTTPIFASNIGLPEFGFYVEECPLECKQEREKSSTLRLQRVKTLRVQVPHNHILTQNLYCSYYYP